MVSRRRIAVLAMGLAVAGLTERASAQSAAAPTQITVQADRAGATIEPDIFGQFAEHLGTGIYGGVWVGKDSAIPNVRGIRTDVVQALCFLTDATPEDVAGPIRFLLGPDSAYITGQVLWINGGAYLP